MPIDSSMIQISDRLPVGRSGHFGWRGNLNDPGVNDLNEKYVTWLRWLLAIIGCGLMVAMIPMCFPRALMATIHGWLGLGEFPDAPITLYLARSTSLMYAVHGTLMLFVSFDVKRYWPMVAVFGWLHVLIGVVMFCIDWTSPMPLYWIAGEGIPIALAGLLIVWLWRMAGRPVWEA
jgi:hypothetical protein